MAEPGLEELEQSEHFKMIQRNKQQLEPQQQQPPQPQQPTNPDSGIAGILETVTQALHNPMTRSLIVANPAVIKGIIDEHASNYKPIIYSYLQSSYPDIYEALSKVEPEQPEDKPEPAPEDGNEPNVIEKPVPREALNYEMVEMNRDGYTATEIADYLSEKYDITLYPMMVGRTIKRLQAAAAVKQPIIPKVDLTGAIASQVAQKLPASSLKQPAPIPAPIKFPDVDGMYNTFISTVRWSAVALLTGVIGFILGRLV